MDPIEPTNPTDRNVTIAKGCWGGHITLPTAMVSGLFCIVVVGFLLIIHWQFEQAGQMRGRLRTQDQIIQKLLQDKGIILPPLPAAETK